MYRSLSSKLLTCALLIGCHAKTNSSSTSAPKLTATSPAEGSSQVATTLSAVSLTFDTAMSTSAGSVAATHATVGALTWSDDAQTLSIALTGLTCGQHVTLALAGFASVDGTAFDDTSLLGDGALDFDTAACGACAVDATAPTLMPVAELLTVPAGGTTGTFTLVFSEPVTGVAQALSSSVGTVTATDAGAGTTWTVSVTGLSPAADGTITLAAGVTDACGNALAGTTTVHVTGACGAPIAVVLPSSVTLPPNVQSGVFHLTAPVPLVGVQAALSVSLGQITAQSNNDGTDWTIRVDGLTPGATTTATIAGTLSDVCGHTLGAARSVALDVPLYCAYAAANGALTSPTSIDYVLGSPASFLVTFNTSPFTADSSDSFFQTTGSVPSGAATLDPVASNGINVTFTNTAGWTAGQTVVMQFDHLLDACQQSFVVSPITINVVDCATPPPAVTLSITAATVDLKAPALPLTFSHTVARAELEAALHLETAPTGRDATFTLTGSGQQWQLTPTASDWQAGDHVTVVVAPGVHDICNTPTVGPLSATFAVIDSCVGATTGASLALTSGQSFALGYADVRLIFTEAIKGLGEAQLAITAATGSGQIIPGSLRQFSAQEWRVAIGPATINDSYVISISPSVTDLCGNPSEQSYTQNVCTTDGAQFASHVVQRLPGLSGTSAFTFNVAFDRRVFGITGGSNGVLIPADCSGPCPVLVAQPADNVTEATFEAVGLVPGEAFTFSGADENQAVDACASRIANTTQGAVHLCDFDAVTLATTSDQTVSSVVTIPFDRTVSLQESGLALVAVTGSSLGSIKPGSLKDGGPVWTVEVQDAAPGDQYVLTIDPAAVVDSCGNVPAGALSFNVLVVACADTDGISAEVIPFVPFAERPLAHDITRWFDDDNVSAVRFPIGFTFDFFGQPKTDFRLSSNGFLTFSNDTQSGCCDGLALPLSGASSDSIYFLWTDLDPGIQGAVGSVSYETFGTAPNRRLEIMYAHMMPCCSNIDAGAAKLVLYETSNLIEVHVRTFDSLDNAIAFGVMDSTTSVAAQLTGDALKSSPVNSGGANRVLGQLARRYKTAATPDGICDADASKRSN